MGEQSSNRVTLIPATIFTKAAKSPIMVRNGHTWQPMGDPSGPIAVSVAVVMPFSLLFADPVSESDLVCSRWRPHVPPPHQGRRASREHPPRQPPPRANQSLSRSIAQFYL